MPKVEKEIAVFEKGDSELLVHLAAIEHMDPKTAQIRMHPKSITQIWALKRSGQSWKVVICVDMDGKEIRNQLTELHQWSGPFDSEQEANVWIDEN